jgi:HK97 family phage major capsid protein
MRWAMLPEKLEAMLEVLEIRAYRARPFTAEEIEARMASVPNPAAHQAANIQTGKKGGLVAVLPLTGLIMPKASMVNGPSLPQGTSCESFAAAFDAAIADETVTHIVIDVDSPGGAVIGVPELAARMLAARGKKPVTAVANSLAASAAYWLCSTADEVVVAPSGEVGSIGVFCVHEDDSEAYAQMGVKHTIIKAGEYKAEGNPYEPLSEEAKASIQSDIDEFYSMFLSSVAKARKVSVQEVADNFGQGRTVLAKAAVKAGMADRVATLEQVLAKLGVPLPAYSNGRKSSASAESEDLDVAASSFLAEDVQALSRVAGPGSEISVVRIGNRSIAKLIPAGVAAELSPSHEPQPGLRGQEHNVPDTEAAAPGASAPSSNATIQLAERARAKEIRKLCKDHKVDDANFADDLIERGVSVEAAKGEILEAKRAEVARAPRISGVHDRSLDKPWKNFGEQLAAVKEAYSPGGRTDLRLAAASGMNQAIPSEGGFSVAPQFSQTIWDGLAADPNGLLSMTDNYTVEGESLTFMANAETSRATGSRAGGVRGYWIAEADQLTKSTPKLRTVKVEPQQMAVLVYVTEKLLRNSPVALEQFVSRSAIAEIGFLTGDAIVNGTGAGQPKGLLNSGCVISVAKETSQPNTTFNKQNANKMWARLHPNARKNAVWLYNVDVEPQFDEFNTPIKNVAGSENVGGIGTQIYNAEKNTLKGRPLMPIEFCPTLGTVGDVILADLSGYLTGTRGGIDTAISMHVRFEFAEQAFRFIYEVDGQPWLAAALTPYKGANTLSTFVTLASRP